MTDTTVEPGPRPLELGLDTFGDATLGPDGTLLPHGQVIRSVQTGIPMMLAIIGGDPARSESDATAAGRRSAGHEKLLHGIELYGTQVIPRVREILSHPVGPAFSQIS